MTSTETQLISAATATRPRNRRPKSVLFCPSCSHESPLDGDWEIVQDGETRTYRCPNCRAVVSNR